MTENQEKSDLTIEKDEVERIRFEWLDQFRGLVILLFIISVITWKLSADLLIGEIPVVPANLDHGWRLFDSYYSGDQKHDPSPITIIDIGQQILMFLVGFMQAFSYRKRKIRNGITNARMHVLKRYTWMMALSFLLVIIDSDITNVDGWIWGWLFNNTLTGIAWGGLFAGIITEVFDDGDKQLYTGFGVLLLHGILYAIPAIRTWESGWMRFPWAALGHIGIGMVAAAYSTWVFDDEMKINEESWAKKVVPTSILAFVIWYFVDWIQFAQHHHVTFALALMSIGTSGFMIWIFYEFDKMGIKIPGLTAMGKNMFLMFILSGLFIDLFYWPLMEDILSSSRISALLLGGVLPIIVLWFFAKLMEKKGKMLKI